MGRTTAILKGTGLTTTFDERLARCRAQVEDGLRGLLRDQSAVPPKLAEAMGYSLFAGGKRLRPILVIFAHEAIDGASGDPIPAACAVEMVHTYSLIHDDLPAMDDDDFRRGQPTCHKRFDSEALAILAGDGLLTLAFETLASRYPPKIAAVSIRELARGAGAAGMVGGQTLDLAADGKIGGVESPTSVADLEGIHAHKTGALFRASLRIGGHLAGASDSDLARLDDYGTAFGLAFQITDDLLDVEGTLEKTGKRVGKDAGRGKLTYPGLIGVAESRRLAAELCDRAVTAAGAFGPRGEPLSELARRSLRRDH